MITMYIKAKYSNSQSFYLWFILNSCLTDYIESQVLIVTKKYHPQYGYILVKYKLLKFKVIGTATANVRDKNYQKAYQIGKQQYHWTLILLI